jgi:hypothetical protein
MGQKAFLRDNKTLDSLSIAADDDGDALDLEYVKCFSVIVAILNTTPVAKTFVDGDVTPADDTIGITGHGFLTGLKVAASTSGVLPAGLSAGNYYVIKVDDDTIKLATTQANAVAGTAVDITAAAGGGTHTLTPATLSGTVKLQGCNDPGAVADLTNWVDIPNKSSAFTGGGNVILSDTDPPYKFCRVVHVLSAGQITSVVNFCSKGG